MKRFIFLVIFILISSFFYISAKELVPYLDLDEFSYLDGYPSSFDDIDLNYSEIVFIEKRYDSYMGRIGKYAYAYRSDSISFYLYGDSKDEAQLYYLEIYSKNYENRKIRILGCNKADIIKILEDSTYRFNIDNDEIVINSNDFLYFISIVFEDDIVKSYSINRSL